MDILNGELAPTGSEGTSDTTSTSNDSVAGKNNTDKLPLKQKLIAVTIGELVNMNLPTRENLLTPWLPMQGLAMVFAPRGIGKTFFSLNVAYAVASGGEYLCWNAPQAQKVLYIDGEMPAITMQERLKSIIEMHSAEAEINYLTVITPDLQEGNPMPDLSTVKGQAEIEHFLADVKLIVIDNISTLCRSGTENEAESWETVQAWALKQRSAGRTVLFVHHAGKGGNQRGTSKREDVLDTVINLKRATDYSPSQGASFELHFEKTRGFSGDDAEPLQCSLGTDQHNKPVWLYSRLEDKTFDKVVTLFNEGLKQFEIASEMQIHKSTVSRHINNARSKGLLKGGERKPKSGDSTNRHYLDDEE